MEQSRDKIISNTSILCIVVNVCLAILKVVVGLLSLSAAVIAEAINNITDALSSIITLVGSKLAKKHPDKKHPFGYGRIEYLTSLVIGIMIIVAGVETITGAIENIITPVSLNVSYVTIIIIAVTCIIKFFLGTYTIKMGKKASSEALVGVGKECRQDSLVSLVTIISSLIFVLTSFSIDSYASIVTSLFILKAGFDVLKVTVGDILGRPGDRELASRLYKRILSNKMIITAADMMLHSYGPNKWSGSVNIELDHKLTVGEIYNVIHKLQLDIMHEEKVTMVFGIYAVDNDSENIKGLRQCIQEFISHEDNVHGYHALYLDESTNTIYCDFVVDYKLKDWDSLKDRYLRFMEGKYPGKNYELVIETQFV